MPFFSTLASSIRPNEGIAPLAAINCYTGACGLLGVPIVTTQSTENIHFVSVAGDDDCAIKRREPARMTGPLARR